MALSSDSRFRFTKLHTDVATGRRRFGPWVPPNITLDDAQEYIVTAADAGRLDNIAHRLLGNSRYWWAIAYANNIWNPLRDVVAGMTLVIPSRDAVENALASEQVTV